MFGVVPGPRALSSRRQLRLVHGVLAPSVHRVFSPTGGGPAGVRTDPLARRRGVSCDSWGAMSPLVTAVSGRNTPTVEWLAHVVLLGLGFPYI